MILKHYDTLKIWNLEWSIHQILLESVFLTKCIFLFLTISEILNE